VNIAAAMAALAIRDLEHAAKMCALVVACRADQDTLGGWEIGRLAVDLEHHPGAISRTLRTVPGKYLLVDRSVVYLGSYFEPRNLSRRMSRNLRDDNSLEIKEGRNLAELEAGASGDNAAAAAALAEMRASLSHVLNARLDGRRRR
jgi:hypothetical protein